MKGRRVTLGLAGTVALVLAVAGGANAVPVRSLVTALGNDYLLVVAIGGVGLLVAIPVLTSGRDGNLVQADMPAPERPVTVPPAGHDFDETVGSWRYRLPVVGRKRRHAVEERLRTAAVETVMRAENCSRNEAKRLVETGKWTDDSTAAAYLSSSDVSNSSAGRRVSSLLTGRTWHQHCAHRTAAEIADRGEEL
ncbi:hypothetical protein ZOD2009_15476 [Haladaptatus paucihalophilus DX253]|uniref:Uncharacterized protein n=1 Tax=Haladaptatus paucihalophilus DX253 TaxID=797209 RepID=E7QWA7_HALPU|nr:hypothetical protein [Haladaptatus paucihalophilus]EFW91241.1 hypothetical protein ZOD2009_15476 [Haladaptatus paucihalophilus DX253]SHL66609.1 hypothetical protein SAMN05444342_4368 [Haladaptatus paucihalophilus DX253]